MASVPAVMTDSCIRSRSQACSISWSYTSDGASSTVPQFHKLNFPQARHIGIGYALGPPRSMSFYGVYCVSHDGYTMCASLASWFWLPSSLQTVRFAGLEVGSSGRDMPSCQSILG